MQRHWHKRDTGRAEQWKATRKAQFQCYQKSGRFSTDAIPILETNIWNLSLLSCIYLYPFPHYVNLSHPPLHVSFISFHCSPLPLLPAHWWMSALYCNDSESICDPHVNFWFTMRCWTQCTRLFIKDPLVMARSEIHNLYNTIFLCNSYTVWLYC